MSISSFAPRAIKAESPTTTPPSRKPKVQSFSHSNPQDRSPPPLLTSERKTLSVNSMSSVIKKAQKSAAMGGGAAADDDEGGDGVLGMSVKAMQWAVNFLASPSQRTSSSSSSSSSASAAPDFTAGKYAWRRSSADGESLAGTSSFPGDGSGGGGGGGGLDGDGVSSGDGGDERTAAIVCLGVAGEDFLAYVDGFPAPDGKVRTTRSAVAGGGNAANTATAIARLGEPVGLAASVGLDRAGEVGGYA